MPEVLICDACTITIGDGFMESKPFKVGETILCGECYTRLLKGERVEMADEGRGNKLDRARQGGLEHQTSLYLHPDGSIKRELVTLLEKKT